MNPSIIIYETTRIESNIEKEIHVPLNEVEDLAGKSYERNATRVYHIHYGRDEYYVHCPEVKVGDEIKLVVPSFLAPGHKFPICVYIYAITMYVVNPNMGQRKAAELTRERFNLGSNTFSHTTLGRALKKFEQIIHCEAQADEAQADKAQENHFPTVKEMHKRKKAVLDYLKEASGDAEIAKLAQVPAKTCPQYENAFIDVCRQISVYTYKNRRRYLFFRGEKPIKCEAKAN